MFYFETKVCNTSMKNLLVIGFSNSKFELNKQLGAHPGSIGYRADGKLFTGSASAVGFGKRYEIGDVIGCGLIISTGDVFLTANGKFLGKTSIGTQLDMVSGDIYPSVCLQILKEEVQVNFGAEPFVFDTFGH
jgi:hypothetical protein